MTCDGLSTLSLLSSLLVYKCLTTNSNKLNWRAKDHHWQYMCAYFCVLSWLFITSVLLGFRLLRESHGVQGVDIMTATFGLQYRQARWSSACRQLPLPRSQTFARHSWRVLVPQLVSPLSLCERTFQFALAHPPSDSSRLEHFIHNRVELFLSVVVLSTPSQLASWQVYGWRVYG